MTVNQEQSSVPSKYKNQIRTVIIAVLIIELIAMLIFLSVMFR